MNRRALLSLAASAAFARPAIAQPRPPILGFLNDTGANAGPTMLAILRGLSRHGFISNQTVLLVYQQVDRYEDAPAMAESLVKRGAAAIVTLTSANVALAAREATKTLPIVFACPSDPVRLGLVASLAQPGGNLTGVQFAPPVVIEKRARLLAALTPLAKKAGLLVNSSNRAAALDAADLRAVLGPDLTIFEISNDAEIDDAFSRAARNSISAMGVSEDSRLGAPPAIKSSRRRRRETGSRPCIPREKTWRRAVSRATEMSAWNRW